MTARPGQASYRHPWHKRKNGFVRHPKWRRVAVMTGLHVTMVIAVVDALMEAANIGRPRGSLAEVSLVECAIDLDMAAESIGRIYGALEEIGWIEREYLVTWDEHNRDREDPTNAERQQRFRDRQKGAAPDAIEAAPRLSTERNVTERYVTPEEKRIERRDPVDNFSESASGTAAGLSEGQQPEISSDPQGAALLWLATEGERIVSDKMIEPRSTATKRIERWCHQALEGDASTLADIIRAVDATDYVGARFHNLVVDKIRRAPRRQSPQHELKLPPVPISERKLG